MNKSNVRSKRSKEVNVMIWVIWAKIMIVGVRELKEMIRVKMLIIVYKLDVRV